MFSDSPHHWSDPQVILRPAAMWESVKIGNCGSPIETEAGWLVITHGVGPDAQVLHRRRPARSRRSDQGHRPPRRAAALPRKATSAKATCPTSSTAAARCSTGASLILPYAVSDRASAIASVSLDDLLAALRPGPSEGRSAGCPTRWGVRWIFGLVGGGVDGGETRRPGKSALRLGSCTVFGIEDWGMCIMDWMTVVPVWRPAVRLDEDHVSDSGDGELLLRGLHAGQRAGEGACCGPGTRWRCCRCTCR